MHGANEDRHSVLCGSVVVAYVSEQCGVCKRFPMQCTIQNGAGDSAIHQAAYQYSLHEVENVDAAQRTESQSKAV